MYYSPLCIFQLVAVFCFICETFEFELQFMHQIPAFQHQSQSQLWVDSTIHCIRERKLKLYNSCNCHSYCYCCSCCSLLLLSVSGHWEMSLIVQRNYIVKNSQCLCMSEWTKRKGSQTKIVVILATTTIRAT